MHYFELPKIPNIDGAHDELNLWLSLFNAKTEEELVKIESIEGEIMEQAVKAYRRVSGTKEFQEIERLRFEAKYNEKAAIRAEAIDIARRMIAKDIDVNVVAEVTKLSVETVLKFCK